MSYFDEKAATWDRNTATLERSRSIAAEIIRALPLKPTWHVFEYGCGTGTLSFFLKPHVGKMTLTDDSREMVKVVREKIRASGMTDMTVEQLNLLEDRYDGTHDCIYTQMVLHHIRDTGRVVGRFYDLLKNGGYLCIADLVEEDGAFHAHHEHYDGHNGFSMENLKALLEGAGFYDVAWSICYTMEKKLVDGRTGAFPLFLMIAKKPV